MSNFHLPYHFVPFVKGAKSSSDTTPATHKQYVNGTHSGRIVCRLQTETPIFVGAKRDGAESPARVEPYRLHGQLAIPASSLRGMVGAVVEAASNSPFRVLNTRARYSVRKKMDGKETLSALGMVLKTDRGWALQPLTIPTLHAERDGTVSLPEKYRPLFPEPNLKVYIGGPSEIKRANFPYRTFRLAQPEWWALPLRRRSWTSDFRLHPDEKQYRKGAYLLAQVALEPGRKPLRREEVLATIPEEQRGDWALGVMRVLGCWGNRTDTMPPGKKHELFLPWPTREDWPTKEIRQGVVDAFEELCEARMQASEQGHERKPDKRPLLPFEPRDTRHREGKGGQRELKLQHGDLVYFGVDAHGDISELSFSAIWREKKARAGEFFPEEFWPYGSSVKERALGDAELLLGYVEDRGNQSQKTDPTKALASRVRFSAGILAAQPEKPVQLPEVRLRVLDAPKPPCPSLYFKSKTNVAGEFVSKHDLSPKLHEAQGRKFYLHQRAAGQWESRSSEANEEQQSRVSPIASGQEFHFHIDFDNLSERELGLLLYGLAPSDEFRHKLGMGKALGLGTVRVEPLAYLRVARDKRYTPEGHAEARYHEAWVGAGTTREQLPSMYEDEREALTLAGGAVWTTLRDAWRQGMNRQIRKALELVGEPRHVKAPVLPPLVEGQTDVELETFKWFVANENGVTAPGGDRHIPAQKQFLRPLTERSDLPVLPQFAWQAKPPRRW